MVLTVSRSPILSHEMNNPLMFLRQPMTIIIKNTDEVLQNWVTQDKQNNEEILQFTLHIRLTQVLSLQHNFVIHQSAR